MKSFYLIALAFVAACSAETFKSDKNVDVNSKVHDKENLRKLIDCITGKGECSKEDVAIKSEFPKALATACAECTDSQKHATKGFLIAFETNFPEEYEAMTKTYDPENKLFIALQKAVAAH